MTDFPKLLEVLSKAGVRFILVGGVAATVHGSTRLTQDLDLVYARNPENIRRLAEALAPYNPYPRGAPPGLPFEWSSETIERGLNFTLRTTLGAVDLFGEVAGGGRYQDLLPETVEIVLFGTRCRCLDLPALIRVKRAAGRPRDFEAIAELEALLEARGGSTGSESDED